MVVVPFMEPDGSLAVDDGIHVDTSFDEFLDLRSAGRILGPLPGRVHWIPDSEALGEHESAGLVDGVVQPVELAPIDLHCGVGRWMDMGLRSRKKMRRVL
ncbi:hypothetical protein MPTK1_7g06460 [Marchantia polymorpha subsp. ruderalis]|uniref:Uncharacterized protein n=2 Tax=Marchantia polymorpha TaxID=3197 RepID=A0AAF6BWS2_MARPO|nr:hypothetical protein MARPO_0057s0024 [Marchantia polymorpha]BBN16456.1 hypothetical protein Mp_7g06460 [Marchantia polymorpha subsp. ruderalis]|eukprot:PTQ37384.1 hypothetical protein MARPO_0057s0024 [Marchantia polymorpha]